VEDESKEDKEPSEPEDQSDASFDPVASNISAEQFFTTTMLENPRHKWLTGFYNYLSRPAMSDKKKAICLQHARQMRILLDYIDPKGDDITCLAQDEGDAVSKRWLKPTLNSGSKKAGTVISYLTTFEKFLTYVTNPRYNQSGPALHPDFDIFRQVLPEIKGWRSTVDSHTQAEQNQRFMVESDALLTPAEKAQLKTSEPYVEGLKAINQADQGKVLSLQEYISARDLLLAIFSLDNGTRPHPLNNATLKDYGTAKTKKGNRIMLVARHKRSKEGPAILSMTQELQRLMEIYIQKIRPKFAPQSENHLFLTKEGQPFPEGTIGRRTRAFFLKTKLRIGEKLANVSLRKFVSTKTKEWATPEEAVIVQRVMCHSQKTAERAYVRTSLTRLGSQALDIIARVTSEEKPELEKSDDINTEKQPASANEVKPSTRTKVVEESTPDPNELPCSVSRPVAPPPAANQSTDKIE